MTSQTISEVYVSREGTKLQAIVNICSEDAVVEVSESSDQVGLAARAPRKGWWWGSDCLTPVVVTLKAPLAQRPVVDQHTGEVLDVAEEQPGAVWGRD